MLISRNSFIDYAFVFSNRSKWKFDRVYVSSIIAFWYIQESIAPPIVCEIFKDMMAFYLCHHIFVYVLDSILLTFVLTIVFSVIFTYFLNLNKIVKWLLSK